MRFAISDCARVWLEFACSPRYRLERPVDFNFGVFFASCLKLNVPVLLFVVSAGSTRKARSTPEIESAVQCVWADHFAIQTLACALNLSLLILDQQRCAFVLSFKTLQTVLLGRFKLAASGIRL